MAFVHDDDVEEVSGVVPEVWRRLPIHDWATHECLEDREEQAAILGDSSLLPDGIWFDSYQSIVRECGERYESLIDQNVPIRKEQNPRSSRWFVSGSPVGKVPATLKQFPCKLKGDERLAGTSRKSQQDSILAFADRVECFFDGDVLIVSPLKEPASIFKRNGCKTVSPFIRNGKGLVPEFIGRWKRSHFAFVAGLHVNAVDASTVRRKRVPQSKLVRVVLRLPNPFRQFLIPSLRLNRRQLGVLVLQNVVSLQSVPTTASALQPSQCNRILATNATSDNNTPAGRSQCRVDVFCSGLSFVHGDLPIPPVRGVSRCR
jgi:hypothetical protein